MVLVSIVIPTYNEEKDIILCIQSLKEQTFKNFEIIVVDDGSTDKTINIVKRSKNIKLIKSGHKGPGFSRNLGAKTAKGSILVFVDADMTFSKDYIKNLIQPILTKKSAIGTTHDYEIVNNLENIWSRCWGRVRVSKKEANKVKIFRAIRKDDFLKLGGFDPKYGYADDQTFWFKYKIKPIVAPNTICYHKNPETLKQVYRQSRWIGASLDNFVLKLDIIKYTIPFFLFLASPLAIILGSFRKCYILKNFRLFHFMILFILVRYLGIISGITRNIYFKVNYR